MSPPSCRLFSHAQGENACFKTKNINAGTSSCHSYQSCKQVSDSTIGNDSCHGTNSCISVQRSTIHDGSCHGGYSCHAANSVQNSTIHDGSCRCDDGHCCAEMQNSIIGKGSCSGGSSSCEYVVNVKIGSNSCNGKKVCYKCKHNVPDNACNQGITDDVDSNGYCNYCK